MGEITPNIGIKEHKKSLKGKPSAWGIKTGLEEQGTGNENDCKPAGKSPVCQNPQGHP